MTIWIIALLLVLSLAGLGYRQGAIRVAFSLVGIFFGVLLAVPLGKPAAILLKAFGMTNPVLLWLLPPLLSFCIISAIFKSIALAVHHKVEVHFKYKAGDLRMSLWERLNHRVGLCLGVVNGVAYMCVLSFVIYIVGYWTVQLESAEGVSWSARLFSRAAKDLQNSGFVKTARAFDKMPASYYEAADVAGLIYQNSLLEARLSRYPAFLMLGEKPEFQALADDQTFSEMRARKDSASQLLSYEPVQGIVKNPDVLRELWGIAEPDLKDLKVFLETAHSPKYSEEPILGRWNFDAGGAVAALRKSNPNMTPLEMRRARVRLEALYSQTKVIVGTEGRMVIKEWPDFSNLPAQGQPQPLVGGTGEWEGGGGFYKIKMNLGSGETDGTASVEGERLTISMGKVAIAFQREI